MIILHNLHNEQIALNGALIERVEGDPETHVTLTSGTRYSVRESLREVVSLQREDRAEVQTRALQLLADERWPSASEEPGSRRLQPVPSVEDDSR